MEKTTLDVFSQFVLSTTKDHTGDIAMRLPSYKFYILIALLSMLFLSPPPGKAQVEDDLPINLDIILLIDNSVSMSTETDQEAIRIRASRFLVDYLRANADASEGSHRVGLVSFGGTMGSFQPLSELHDDSVLDSIVVEEIRYTDFIPPLEAALQEFRSKSLGTDNQKAIILFTDGHPDIAGTMSEEQIEQYFNNPAMIELMADLQAENVDLFLIALGDAQDDREHWRQLIPHEQHYISIDDTTELVDAFHKIIADLMGIASMPEKLPKKKVITVEPHLELLSLSFVKSNPATEIAVKTPGELLLAPTRGSTAKYYQIYSVPHPERGKWTVTWQGEGSVDFWVDKQFPDAQIGAIETPHLMGDPLKVVAKLLRDGKPISSDDLEFEALLTPPHADTTSFSLLPRADGTYARTVEHLRMTGDYQLKVDVMLQGKQEPIASTETVTFTVLAAPGIRGFEILNEDHTISQTITLQAIVKHFEQLPSNSSLTVTVSGPVTDTFTLHDDGVSPDQTSNDGAFTGESSFIETPGHYIFELSASGTTTQGMPYSLVGHTETDIVALSPSVPPRIERLEILGKERVVPQTAILQATVSHYERLPNKLNLEVKINGPITSTFRLHDDGKTPDAKANDGIFSGESPIIQEPGLYRFEVSAEDLDPENMTHNLRSYAETSFRLPKTWVERLQDTFPAWPWVSVVVFLTLLGFVFFAFRTQDINLQKKIKALEGEIKSVQEESQTWQDRVEELEDEKPKRKIEEFRQKLESSKKRKTLKKKIDSYVRLLSEQTDDSRSVIRLTVLKFFESESAEAFWEAVRSYAIPDPDEAQTAKGVFRKAVAEAMVAILWSTLQEEPDWFIPRLYNFIKNGCRGIALQKAVNALDEITDIEPERFKRSPGDDILWNLFCDTLRGYAGIFEETGMHTSIRQINDVVQVLNRFSEIEDLIPDEVFLLSRCTEKQGLFYAEVLDTFYLPLLKALRTPLRRRAVPFQFRGFQEYLKDDSRMVSDLSDEEHSKVNKWWESNHPDQSFQYEEIKNWEHDFKERALSLEDAMMCLSGRTTYPLKPFQNELKEAKGSLPLQDEELGHLPEVEAFESVVNWWLGYIREDLSRTRTKSELSDLLANLQVKLLTNFVPLDGDNASVWFQVTNGGPSWADNIKITLRGGTSKETLGYEELEDVVLYADDQKQFKMELSSVAKKLNADTNKKTTVSFSWSYRDRLNVHDPEDEEGAHCKIEDKNIVLFKPNQTGNLENFPAQPLSLNTDDWKKLEVPFWGWDELLKGHSHSRVIHIYGSPLIGKSTLAKQITRHLSQRFEEIYIDLEQDDWVQKSSEEGILVRVFREKLIHEIGAQLGEAPWERGELKREELPQEISSIADDQNLVLVFDNYGPLTEVGGGQARRDLALDLEHVLETTPHCYIFVGDGSLADCDDYTDLLSNEDVVLNHKLSLLDLEKLVSDVFTWLTDEYSNWYKRFSQKLLLDLLTITAGHPYLVRLVINATFRHHIRKDGKFLDEGTLDEIVTKVITQDPSEGVGQLWRRLSPKEQYILLALIAAASEDGTATSTGVEIRLMAYQSPLAQEIINPERILNRLVEENILYARYGRYRIRSEMISRWISHHRKILSSNLDEKGC